MGLSAARRIPGRAGPWLAVLCLVAAARIFFFSAAFPFFNNVDEHAHFDLIWKYAHGQYPEKGNDTFDSQAFKQMVLFGSPEYIRKPSDYRGGQIPPPVAVWPAQYRQMKLARSAERPPLSNHEAYSPPVYYWLAGRWLNMGQLFGLGNAGLLYWTRFFNIPVYIGLVIMIYLAARQIFPNSPRRVWCLTILATLIPQDVFYTLNSDVLSPLPGVMVFLLLYVCMTRQRPAWYYFAALGAFLAFALLVKLSNLPLLAMAGAAAIIAGWTNRRWLPDKQTVSQIIIALLFIVIPLTPWIINNVAIAGDWSGAQPKIDHLGWTAKSPADFLAHPIFSLSGMGYFAHELFASFWRGELVWHFDRIAFPALDTIYCISSVLFLLTATFFGLWTFAARRDNSEVILSSAGAFAAVGFMVVLSMMYDFHDCWYPSREKPFFVSGRLLLGSFFPILIAYAYGLERLLGLVKLDKYLVHVTLGFMLAVTLAEFWLHGPVFGSTYNFFHMPLGTIE